MGKYFISLNGKIIKIYKSESRARERFSLLFETLTFGDSLELWHNGSLICFA